MQNKTWRIGALCAAVACGTIACARGVRVESESSGAIAVTPANTRMLPAGVDMLLGLDQAVGTKNSRVGQEFSATLQDDVRAQNGRVVVPEGAKVYGHVTAIHEGNIDKPAAIRLDFDRLAFNGRSYPFEASIVATDHRTSRASRINGRDVAVGALAGGVLGAIIGEADLAGILGGAALGAAAGTVISLGTHGTEPTLAAGTHLEVRTTQTVPLR